MIFSMNLPSSISTPLDACAFIMRWLSSSNVGIKRSAIEIIIATSCAGNPIFLSGVRRSSIAIVISIGLVVAVTRVVALIIKRSLNTIYSVWNTASE